jgi:primase-polymerase (primpol)-like protein
MKASAGGYQPLDVSQLCNLPPELCSEELFVCWREEIRSGKPTKIPVNPKTGSDAESDNPSTWGTFTEATEFYEAHRNKLRGIGRMFSGADELMGVDFDNCLDSHGKIIPGSLAAEWLPQLNSYTEISPSGRGVKVWLWAVQELGGKGGRRDTKRGLEIYSAGRYFTLTGKRLGQFSPNVERRQHEIENFYSAIFLAKRNSPATCSAAPNSSNFALSDIAIIHSASNAKNGQKFQKLWSGNIEGYSSQSEADVALCSLLWFWTGERERVRCLFGQSVLGARAKWKDRPDYQKSTLDLGCKGKVHTHSCARSIHGALITNPESWKSLCYHRSDHVSPNLHRQRIRSRLPNGAP